MTYHLPPLPAMHCQRCGAFEVPTVHAGTGPHTARLNCGNCGTYLKWAPKGLVTPQKEQPLMGGINRVVLLGTISKYGVTVKYAPSGTPCASFVLALSEQGQDGKVHTLFQDCEVWGKKAESIGELEAGQLCLFEGKLAKRKKGESWETIVAGYELTPVLTPQASLTGNPN